MKDLTPLEKEFFKILSGDSIPDEMPFTVNITKAVAALCEKKMKEVHLAHLKFWGISEDDVTMKSLYEKLLKDLTEQKETRQ